MKVNVGLQYILYNTLYQLSVIVYFKIIIFYYVSTKYQSIELFDEDYHTLRHTLIFDMYTLYSDTNIFDMYTLYSDTNIYALEYCCCIQCFCHELIFLVKTWKTVIEIVEKQRISSVLMKEKGN